MYHIPLVPSVDINKLDNKFFVLERKCPSSIYALSSIINRQSTIQVLPVKSNKFVDYRSVLI
jgi:hypothetical protein